MGDRKEKADRRVVFARHARKSLVPYWSGIAALSVVVNLLLLIAPIYMLQVYDRILTSGSIDTLLWISAICVYLLVVYAVSEAARRRLFVLAANKLDEKMSKGLFSAFAKSSTVGTDFSEEVRHLQRVRTALHAGSLSPFFDLPFVPFFLLLLFIVHPVLGIVGLAGAICLLAFAITARVVSSSKSDTAKTSETEMMSFSSGIARQRNVVSAMGMHAPIYKRFLDLRTTHSLDATDIANHDGLTSANSRAMRQGLQILILGLGGLLAVQQQVSAGAIVAGSIIMGRALGPIDQLVHSWRNLMEVRYAWTQLNLQLQNAPADEAFTPLPKPRGHIELKSLSIGVPAAETALVKPFSVTIAPGELIALVGPNGGGKSTLLQTLSGAWRPVSGEVVLDGRDIHAWPAEDRGRHVGYVPQGVELLPGTVKQNISRFAEDASDESIFAVTRLSGVHQIILSLPDGYDTSIGPGGMHLSAGQAQSIAIARALYGNPSLVLLDEPTANLDLGAASIFLEAIKKVRHGEACVVVSTHDMRVIRQSTKVIVLSEGKAMLGTPDQFIRPANSDQPASKAQTLQTPVSQLESS